MKAITIGDLHLDGLAKYFPSNHLELQFAEIRKPLNYAISHGIRHVFFLGDIGENTELSYDAISAFIKFLSEYQDKFVFHFLLGNHDFAENGVHCMTPFVTMVNCGLLKNVHIYEKKTKLKIQGAKFNLCPYPYSQGEDEHVNMGHFSTPGATLDNGYKEKEGTKIRKRHKWVLGHLHTPHGNFNGTLYQLGFPERLPKGFGVITASNKSGKLKFKREFIQTDPAFKLINLAIESKSDLKQIEKNPLYLYRLVVKSSFELPDNLMTKYPNIFKIVGVKNKKDFEAIIADENKVSLIDDNGELPSEKKLLKLTFKKKGLSKTQYSRGLELVSKAKESLRC